MEGEWSSYGGGQFKERRMVVVVVACNGGRMVMLERWPVQWRKNGHVTEVVSVSWRENGHVIEVVSLME